jgi:hypothetical protein
MRVLQLTVQMVGPFAMGMQGRHTISYSIHPDTLGVGRTPCRDLLPKRNVGQHTLVSSCARPLHVKDQTLKNACDRQMTQVDR